MTKSLHDQFSESEHPPAPPDADGILHRCKEMLYRYPTGRHLIDVLNLHHIPVILEQGDTAGYSVRNHTSIVLILPPSPQVTEMSFHLACAIRAVELHLQSYTSPEMKDSRAWIHPHLAEPFELMLVICKLAYDMKYDGPNGEVDAFLEKYECEKIYHAYEQKHSYAHIEELMLDNFRARN